MADNTKFINKPLVDEMRKSFISYAMSVNVSRAIPDVRDGLKPVHRRILYAMGELGLDASKPFRKCARIVGDVLGKYHPHGDSAVYEALVRLAQDFSIRYPLVDGQGNFGSIDGDPAAAQRYTEARLTKIAGEMLREIDKNTVDYYPNFDDTLMQPKVLPSRFPNLLVNGSEGIAVGMATNIPPHSLDEVINGVIALIDNKEITVDELMTIIPAPDYPTRGIILGRSQIKNAYRTGRGGVTIRARAEIEETNAGQKSFIIVTELPYQVNKAKLIMQIADLVKDKKIEDISDIRDESDRKGLRIVIDVKKGADAKVVLNMLYKHTTMQVSNGITFLALVDGEPKILNLKEMLFHYLEHQKEVIVRRTRFDLEKAEERKHILEGLVVALANIDEVIKIIRKSKDRVEASEKLTKSFKLSDKQATAILDMRLSRLTSLEVEKIKEELNQLTELVKELKSILASPKKVLEIIKKELTEIKEKFGNGRRTEISIDYSDINIADLIEKEDVIISKTYYGYIKRMPVSEYQVQKRGGKGLKAHKPKEEDFVETMFIANTHDDLLCFSNRGKVYMIKGYEVPEFARGARGRALVNLLDLKGDEKVVTIIARKEDQKGFLMLATKRGLIKKTDLTQFERINKAGKIAIAINDDDELLSVSISSGYDEVLVGSHEGKCVRFGEQDIRPMGRNSAGVRSMKIGAKDYVVDMVVIKPGHDILTISENGFGKRSDPDDYRMQTRGGKGTKAGKFNEQTGRLVNLKQVKPDQDVILISSTGVIIRMKATDISRIGRDTKGVRVMKMKDGGKVISASIAERGEELDEEGEVTE
ncbi:MAG: DNA gyrase subunit A [Firmicutes bacterium]|nr:DNA gyrase subunit A [Bacillota bacterium]